MAYSRQVNRFHQIQKCGPLVYYLEFNREDQPSGCAVMRDPVEIKQAIEKGAPVYLVDRSCGLCGGDTPCLRH